MNNKAMVVISRHWHGPEIKIAIDHEAIRLEISLEDFVKALVAEIRHPVTFFTRGGLEGNIVAAIDTVLAKAKEASIHNPPAPLPQPE